MDMTCRLNMQKGHNKRGCPQKDIVVPPEPQPKKARGRHGKDSAPLPMIHHSTTAHLTQLGRGGRMISGGKGARGRGTGRGKKSRGRGLRGGSTRAGHARGDGTRKGGSVGDTVVSRGRGNSSRGRGRGRGRNQVHIYFYKNLHSLILLFAFL